MGTEDRGFESVFESNDHDMNRLLPDAPYRYHGKDQTFYIKVCLQEQFQTELVTNDYNSKLVTGMVGLENLGATCYLNSLLQMLFHINAFRACVYKLPCQDEVYGSSTTLALQNVFRQLQMSDKEVNTQVSSLQESFYINLFLIAHYLGFIDRVWLDKPRRIRPTRCSRDDEDIT